MTWVLDTPEPDRAAPEADIQDSEHAADKLQPGDKPVAAEAVAGAAEGPAEAAVLAPEAAGELQDVLQVLQIAVS